MADAANKTAESQIEEAQTTEKVAGSASRGRIISKKAAESQSEEAQLSRQSEAA